MSAAFREAVAEDAKAIERLIRQLFDEPSVSVLPERLEEVRANPNSFVFVLESDGLIVATVQLFICLDIMFGNMPYAIIENIVVDKNSRGAGLGNQLIKNIERICRQKDCSEIMLLSTATRTEAHHFFTLNGFSGDAKKGFVKFRGTF